MSRLCGRARLYINYARVSLCPSFLVSSHDRGASLPSVYNSMSRETSISSLCRHFHNTYYRQSAVPKLKEVPLDTPDDVDTTKPADYNPSNFDTQESRNVPSEKILRIADEIAHLSLIEASDLSYLLQKKLGLSEAAMPFYGGGMGSSMGAAQGAGVPAATEEKKPEKTNFDVKLEKFDPASKIKVIKEVRAFTTLGLKEAKELVERLPAIVKAGVGKEEAEQMVEKLKAVGGTAVLE